MRLLIAYDGSPYADAVLSDLPRAGLAGAHDALVLSVADVILLPDDLFTGPSLSEAVARDIRTQAPRHQRRSYG